MFNKSIRWRIQVWHGALLVVLVAGMLGAFYSYERGERVRALDSQLQALLTPLLPSISPPDRMPFEGGPPPGPEGGMEGRPPGRNHPVPSEFAKGAFYYAAWTPNHEPIVHSVSNHIPMPAPNTSGKGQFFRDRGKNRELVYFGPRGDTVVIGASMSTLSEELHRLAVILTILGLGIVLFGWAGGWWLAGYALRPIDQISGAARQIAGGNRAKRIDLRETQSELGQLAEVLNRTFDQQDNAFEQQVRFTADASHELRTPVSVILTQVQLALSRDRDAQEYRETLQICQRAAERMRALVNSLLELARVDSGEFKLNLDDCDLGVVASDALELIAPLVREKGATIKSSVPPIRVKADAARLGQVLVNLLCNAIQHNSREVEVVLTIENKGNEAMVRVADNGVGIPEDSLPHVFERFYRADKSRTNSKSGSGLGLAISKAIIDAHHGTIRAENQEKQGAVFTVSLPVAG